MGQEPYRQYVGTLSEAFVLGILAKIAGMLIDVPDRGRVSLEIDLQTGRTVAVVPNPAHPASHATQN